MHKPIISRQTAPHYAWGEGCDSWVLADTEGLSVKEERMPPGTKEVLHYHSEAQQVFYVLSGTAVFYVESVGTVLGKGQAIQVQPGQKHLIANESDRDLSFLVISQPTTARDRITADASNGFA